MRTKKYWELRNVTIGAKNNWFLGFPHNWRHPLNELDDEIRREQVEEIRIEIYRMGNVVDFFLIGFTIPCVTKKLGEIFQKYGGEDIERIPATIENSEFQHGDYEIIKVYPRLDCVDLEKSTYRIYDHPGHPRHGEIACLYKIKLDTSKIGDYHIFKIKKIDNLNEAIFVSDEVKQEIEQQGFTGIRFVRV